MTRIILSDCADAVEQIVVIGAGCGAALPDYLALSPQAITLVEPTPARATRLRAHCAAHPQATVIEAAVTNTAASDLHIFNYGAVNSLRQPLGLTAVFPSLIKQADIPVACVTPKALVENLGLTPGAHNILVIAAPCESMAILEALVAARQLTLFQTVRVCAGMEPLYQDGGTLDQVRRFLATQNFTVAPNVDKSDAALPVLTVSFDVIRDLRRKAADQGQRIADFTANLEEAQTALEDAKANLEETDYMLRKTQNDATQQDLIAAQVKSDFVALQALFRDLQAEKQAQSLLLADIATVLQRKPDPKPRKSPKT